MDRCLYSFFILLVVLAVYLPASPAVSQTCLPNGDINQDGNITASDALLAFQHALGEDDPPLNSCQLTLGDVYPVPTAPDGRITASDALCIFQKALNLASCLDTMDGNGDGGNTFRVGDTIPGFPPNSDIFLGFGRRVSFGGTVYTCRSAGGCEIINGVVTQGTIESSGGTPPPSDVVAPDLVVQSPSVNNSSPDAGASFTLSATVRNGGDGRSAATTLRYYRSSDATISASDTAVGTDSVGGLAASGTSAESISLTAPSSAGTYYYGACVDTVSGESNTANNCSSAVRVTVSAGGGGNTFGVGDTLPGVPAGARLFPVSGWATVWPGVTFSGTLDKSETNLIFDNGGYIQLRNGTRYTCRASGGCRVTNGVVSRGTIVRGGGDGPDDPRPEQTGFAPADQAAFDARAVGKRMLSDDPLNYADFVSPGRFREVEGDDVYTGRYTYEKTGPNSGRLAFFYDGGSSCTSNFTFESATTGTSTYSCSDGSRGTTSWRFVDISTSNAPDLVVQSPSVSDSSPNAGQSFTLRATVRNGGDGRSAATTLRYYRSSNATISRSDMAVGTDAVGALAASGTSAESISLTAPSSTGTYYYGACVDAVSGESDTANNCSSAVRVTVRAGGGGTRYGAVANSGKIIGDSCRWFTGIAVNHTSEEDALNAARQACENDGGSASTCRKYSWSFRNCGAMHVCENKTVFRIECASYFHYGPTLAGVERSLFSGIPPIACILGSDKVATNSNGQRMSGCNSRSSSGAAAAEETLGDTLTHMLQSQTLRIDED